MPLWCHDCGSTCASQNKERSVRFDTTAIGCIRVVCTAKASSILSSCCPTKCNAPCNKAYRGGPSFHRALMDMEKSSSVKISFQIRSLYVGPAALLVWNLVQQWHLCCCCTFVTQKSISGGRQTMVWSLQGCLFNVRESKKVLIDLDLAAQAVKFCNAMHMLWL